MPATTVKIDAPLLKEIVAVKPRDEPLSTYVREALRRDLRRRRMRQAAETYQSLLLKNKSERESMEQWEAAPLAREPRRRRA